MSKIFMPEVETRARKLLLEQNADRVEETTYLKRLTADELDLRRENLTDNAIALNDLNEEKKDVLATFKAKTDPLTKGNKLLLQELKSRQATVTGNIYHMANHEEGMMESYDEAGEMISSRRLRPEEKQQKLFPISKTAN